MQNPVRMAVLLLAPMLLAACTTAQGGKTLVNLSGSNQQVENVSEKNTVTDAADENPPTNKAEPIQTRTATFALG
jgi:hypothetical protein